MRVKDIIEVEDLKKTELPKDLEVAEDNKPSRIRNGLRRVGRFALDALATLGDFASVAGMFLPAVGVAGTAISGISRALSGVGAVGDVAGAIASTAQMFEEKNQMAQPAM